jgi:ABC-type sulfate/molybdate transport systems ATPase subunit
VSDLIVRDLVVERNGRLVLDGCNAEFAPGQRTVLWGPSGAGKSTLLNAIAGLISPRSGTIRIGQRLFFSREKRVDVPPHQRNVGFVFQDLALWPHLTAIDHVCLVSRAVGINRREAQELIESVGLHGLEQRRPGELSGGEQQRLAIARALAQKPSVLLLDEPFSSVDRRNKESLYQLVRETSPLVAGPTIYVTHHADDAFALAESVMTLDRGKLARADRPWEERRIH